ncbi:MAG: PhzF family phenazine biosynthesis protein [Alphaproteobacteria bacterium]|nr:PhzF family phenazine biosynthesis protein [Alphaproteobacteria bacterium]
MRLPIYQVDAFADRRFAGNPAAVVPLDAWLPDATLLAIAAENNLSETAFFVREGARHRLRWFTPATEVDLCGHATLATAHVMYTRLGAAPARIEFESRSGVLAVDRDGDRIVLDFPAQAVAPATVTSDMTAALGAAPVEALANAQFLVAVLDSAARVRELAPDLGRLRRLAAYGVTVTAPGEDCDFVSRHFAPNRGIDEDPVTGSAHCRLMPYWAKRLGRTSLVARQLSRRGGTLWCELAVGRVRIAGHAVTYLEGAIEI